jgi:hypothetical protein
LQILFENTFISLNFYSGYGKDIVKDTWFCYSYGIGFNVNSPFASRSEVLVAVCSTCPADNIDTNSNDIPIALKLINLIIATINARLLFMNNYLAKSTIE